MGNAQQKVPTTPVTKPAVNDGPRPTREIIKLTLIGKGAQFEEKARGIFEILTPTREWKTLVTEGNAKQLLIYHIYLQRVPISNAKKAAKVIETISRLNTVTVLGNLELDMRDGEIRFKLCASILGLSEKTIEKVLIRLLGISPEQNFQKIRNILDEKDTADNNTPPKVSNEVKSLSNEPKPPSVPEIKKGNSDLEKISNSDVKQNMNSPKQKEEDVKIARTDINDFVIDWKMVKKGDKIGKGAFAKVFKGEWLGNPVALKVINMTLANDVRENFEKEFKAMVNLHHPNIVLLFGVCLEPDLVLVTELLSGSLHDFIHKPNSKYGDFPMKKKVDLCLQIARGLAYIHFKKILHGDLKPLNILLDSNENIRLADFGLARFKSYASSVMPSINSGNTFIPAMGFTMPYASPELLSDMKMSEKSDTFATAIIFFEMLAMRSPWGTMLPMELINAIKSGKRPDISLINGAPSELINLIKQCWEQDVAKRLRAQDIVDRLIKIRAELQ